MSNVIIDRDKIDILANAIATKSGEALPLTLTEMVEAVDGIEQGGGSAEPNLQAKTYTVDSAGTETITADNGYDGLSEVAVSVPSMYAWDTLLTRNNYTTVSGRRYWKPQVGIEVYPEGEGWIAEGAYAQTDTFSAVASGTTISPTESAQTIGGANYMMEGAVTVNAIPSNYVGSGITQRSSSDLTASGATVTVPSGYYSAQASKAVASGTAGTPTATKGAVSNHSVSVTPSVTNTTGYITGSTKTGTAVTVTASELASGNKAITQNGTDIDVVGYSTVSVDVPTGGGSVTVTDVANSTGTTCVITSGGSPTPSGIPLNTQLIDFTKTTNDYVVNSSGNVVAEQWYSVSDYTEIDPSMTFTYSGCYWFYIGFYDSSKNTIRALSMNSDGTQRPSETNICDGTLTPSKIPSNAKYVRITSTYNPDSTILSLIRTA